MGEETSHEARPITRAPTLKITPQQKPVSIGPQRTLPFLSVLLSSALCHRQSTFHLGFLSTSFSFFFNGDELFPAPCWDVNKLDLMKVFCRQPQLLWAHVYSGPVKTKEDSSPHFSLTSFPSSEMFSEVRGKEVWYRWPFLVEHSAETDSLHSDLCELLE